MRPVGGRTGSQLIPQETRDKVVAAYEAGAAMADIMTCSKCATRRYLRIADEAGIPRRPAVGGSVSTMTRSPS
jgi:hypothetical protein